MYYIDELAFIRLASSNGSRCSPAGSTQERRILALRQEVAVLGCAPDRESLKRRQIDELWKAKRATASRSLAQVRSLRRSPRRYPQGAAPPNRAQRGRWRADPPVARDARTGRFQGSTRRPETSQCSVPTRSPEGLQLPLSRRTGGAPATGSRPAP